MRIIQIGSSGALLIWLEEMKYLLSDVVAIGGYFFLSGRQVHNSISFVLDHAEPLASLVSVWSSLVGTESLSSIF